MTSHDTSVLQDQRPNSARSSSEGHTAEPPSASRDRHVPRTDTATLRESPLQMDDQVRQSLLERHEDEHTAGHLYDRVAERMYHFGYQGFASHFREAAAEERGPHAQRVEDILHAFDIDPPHPAIDRPHLTGQESVLELLYLAWKTEASLMRKYETTKALAADRDELAVESLVDAILDSQLHEVDEARTLYRRCESAIQDGTGLMAIDVTLTGDQGDA